MNMNLNEKEVEKANRKIDLGGFEMRDQLDPKIWDENQKMRPEVKKTLLKIADDYFESLEIPGVDIEDIIMTGSLANYNWSKYSDVDLHIVIDYKDVPVDKELVQGFFKSKSSNWNKEHDVKIYGYDVEIYVQDINETHHSTGVYSVLNNEWDTKPERKKITLNDKSVKDKSNRFMDRIEDLYDELTEGNYEDAIDGVDKLTEKIKKMRQSGLESGGEFSVENMVFKVLRRNGMLDRLYDIKTVAYDKSVTLESIQESKKLDQLLGPIIESKDPLQWVKDSKFNFNIGDVFVTEYMFNGLNQKRGEQTFEVYDVSPDGRRIRFSTHDTRGIWKGGSRGDAYLPIDKINKESINNNWDKVGYNPANSITVEQATKNINSGFWVKLNTNGYLIDNPSEIDRIIKLGSNKLTESISQDPFQWIRDVDTKTLIDKQPYRSAEYDIVGEYFKKEKLVYKGWSVIWDGFQGVVEWRNQDVPHLFIFATPYWDGADNIPVNYDENYGDDYGHLGFISIPEFEYKEDLINWLENDYFKAVYKLIIDYTGPLAESVNNFDVLGRIYDKSTSLESKKMNNTLITYIYNKKNNG